MITRESIARWLFPDIAKNAARYVTMRDQINTEIWWLAEFPDVRDTLQRLLDRDRGYWRRPSEEYDSDLPHGISEFRETLRRRSATTQTDAEAYADFSRRYAAATTDGELARVLSGQLRQMEKRAKAANARADSAVEYVRGLLEANSRQESCIQRCAAAIGLDTPSAIDSLPRAVKRLADLLRQRWDALPGPEVEAIASIITAVDDIIADAHVSYPAGREAGTCIEYDADELRQRLVAIMAVPSQKEVANG